MRTSELGDCVGIESSADLESDLGKLSHGVELSRRNRLIPATKKEFPPPIPWLASAEDLPSVMKRYCTIDGRLIIKEEKVRRREFLLADRSNGRLVLNLVHVDDGEAEEDLEIDGGGEGRSDLIVEEMAAESCNKYNGVALNSCGGFVATAAVLMPPVHI